MSFWPNGPITLFQNEQCRLIKRVMIQSQTLVQTYLVQMYVT